nr:DHHW family protein [uncultured Cellulosilyticum sp.]
MFTKLKNYSFLSLMSLIILAFSVTSLLLPEKQFSNLENRFLQPMPHFTLESFISGTYTTNFEKAMNDQFPLRDNWISLKSRSELLLGKRENNGIIYGANHYLFKRFDTFNHENLGKNARAIATFTTKHPNTPIYFMLIPDSYTLHSEFLPSHIIKVDQNKCINYIYKYISNTCNINPVNIIPALLRHHDDYIYYRTDHHWTNLGAYLASYNFICTTGNLPLFPNPLENTCKEVTGFYGTYFNESKFMNIQPDTIKYVEPNVSVFIDGKPYPGLYDESKWSSSNKYAAFLWGNNGLTTIINNDLPEKGRRLLLIKDSFGNSAAPYLAYNYRQIDIIDLRSITFSLSDYLLEHDFDDILIMYNLTTFNNDRNISKINY